jgi:putative oxidoreductase
MGRFSTLARTVFGGVLAFMALDNFRDMEGSIGYADAKGVPEADKLVPFSSGMLLFGSIAIVLGRVPRLAAGAIAAFFVGVTPQMHDFWNMEDDQREQEVIHFLKNIAMLGGALVFLARGTEDE